MYIYHYMLVRIYIYIYIYICINVYIFTCMKLMLVSCARCLISHYAVKKMVMQNHFRTLMQRVNDAEMQLQCSNDHGMHGPKAFIHAVVALGIRVHHVVQ